MKRLPEGIFAPSSLLAFVFLIFSGFILVLRITGQTDASSKMELRFDAISLTNGEVRLAISYFTDSNRNYVVEYRDHLGEDLCSDWKPMPLAPHNYGIIFTTNSEPQRYYRLRLIEQSQSPIFALLANDTGTNSLDGWTSDLTITGLAAPRISNYRIEASLDNTNGPYSLVTNFTENSHFLISHDKILHLFGHVEDGGHTLYLRVVNPSNLVVGDCVVQFDFDSTPPPLEVSLDPAVDTSPLNDFQTTNSLVRFLGSTEPELDVELLPLGIITKSDTNGLFLLHDIPLAVGTNYFALRAIDGACNEGILDFSVCLYDENCTFPGNLDGWGVFASDPQNTLGIVDPIRGSVVPIQDKSCSALMSEGDSYVVELHRTFGIPDVPSEIVIQYSMTSEGMSVSHAIRDAFEIAILDSDEEPLTYTIQGINGVVPNFDSLVLPPRPDSCFNHSESLIPWLAPGVVYDSSSGSVRISLNSITPSIEGKLLFRLINNDLDRSTSVIIHSVQFQETSSLYPGSEGSALSQQHPTVSSDSYFGDSNCHATAITFGAGHVALGPVVVEGTGTPIASPRLVINLAAESSVPIGPVLVSGHALVSQSEVDNNEAVFNELSFVTINGAPIDKVDAAGNFFAVIDIQPGLNRQVVVAVDAFSNSTTNTVSILGKDCAAISSPLVNITDSVGVNFQRSSLTKSDGTLYTEIILKNEGTFSVRPPFVVGFNRFSDSDTGILSSDGIAEDGIPYYILDESFSPLQLEPNQNTRPRSIAFSSPHQRQFTFNTTILGRLNEAPKFVSAPTVEIVADNNYLYNVDVYDPDGDLVGYSLFEAPDGMVLNESGVLRWNPGRNDLGTHNVSIRASDGFGGIANQRFVLSVIEPPPNRPPRFVSRPVEEVIFGELYLYNAIAVDPDGDVLDYQIIEFPMGMSIDSLSGIVNWFPTNGQYGDHPVTIRVSDNRGGIAEQKYFISVRPEEGNNAPIIISEPKFTVVPGGVYSYDVEALDSDLDPLNYEILSGPVGLSINASNGLINWEPDPIELTNLFVEFSDGDFDSTVWEDITLLSGNASISHTRTGSGGNPSGFRKAIGDIDRTSGEEREFYAFLSFNFKPDATYFPTNDGPIFSLSYSFDTITLSKPATFPRGLSSSPALLQDGEIYRFGGATSLGNTWRSHNWNNLTESDFALVVSAGESDPTINPDFSERGAPITLGYCILQGAIGTDLHWEEGIDNWSVRVTRQTRANVSLRVTDGRGGIDSQNYQISTLGSSGLQGFVFNDINTNQVWDRHQDLVVCGSRLWRFHGKSGALISRSLRISSRSLAIGPDGNTYVGCERNNCLLVFEKGTDKLISKKSPGIPWWDNYLAFGPDGSLYISTSVRREVLQYDVNSDQEASVFLTHTRGFAVRDIEFGPDNNLYTVSDFDDEITRYNGVTGSFIDTFVNDPNTSRVLRLWWFGFDKDNRLLVNSLIDSTLLEFDASNGNYLGVFSDNVPPSDFVAHTNGIIYIGGAGIFRIDATNGENLGRFDYGDSSIGARDLAFTSSGSEGDLDEPTLAGWTVFIDENGNGRRDIFEPFDESDENGRYSIQNLRPGVHIVRIEVPPGFLQTSPSEQFHTVSTFSGENAYKVNFGNIVGTDTNLNSHPEFVSSPSVQAVVNETYFYDANAFDADGDPLTYSIVSSPAGMVIDPLSGVVGWDPKSSQTGEYSVSIQVSDLRGGIDLQQFDIIVFPVNTAPRITSTPPVKTNPNSAYSYIISAQDAEGDNLTFTIASGPSDMSISSIGGESQSLVRYANLSWNPTTDDNGVPLDISVVVEDGKGKSDIQNFRLAVTDSVSNSPPIFLSSPRTNLWLSLPYVYNITGFDQNGDTVEFELIEGPPGMTLTPSQSGQLPTTQLEWLPDTLGLHEVELRAVDSKGATSEQAFHLFVSSQPQNSTPSIISIPVQTAVVNRSYQYSPKANDPDGDELTWELADSPSGMSINRRNGLLHWQPTIFQVGVHSVTLRVIDSFLESEDQTYSIRVRAANGAPTITTLPKTEVVAGYPYIYLLSAVDPDGDVMSFELIDSPAEMVLSEISDGTSEFPGNGPSPATALLEWMPELGNPGSNSVLIQVSDGNGGVSSQSFNILVSTNPPNRPPYITSEPLRGAVLQLPYVYDVSAIDPDGDNLTFALLDGPSGMQLEPTQSEIPQARLTWTPTLEQPPIVPIAIAVSDGRDGKSIQRFALQVRSNEAPVFRSNPPTNAVPNFEYIYSVNVLDPDNDLLHYYLNQAPDGMTINQFGRLTWVPEEHQRGVHPIMISAVDEFGAVGSQSYQIIVGSDVESPVVIIEPFSGLVDSEGRTIGNVGEIAQFRIYAEDNTRVEELWVTVDNDEIPLVGEGIEILAEMPGLSEIMARAIDINGNIGSATNIFRVIDRDAASEINITIHSPNNEDIITSSVPIIGSITNNLDLLNYRIDFARADLASVGNIARPDPVFTVLTNAVLTPGTRSISNSVLGVFDPLLLLNDQYVIRLHSEDINGNIRTEAITVGLQGELKFGEFRLEYTDLSIPLAGIPIQINRVYDTRNSARSGDFGYGWSLGISDAQIRASLRQGSLYEGSRIYLNTPDGRRVGFTARGRIIGSFGFTFVEIDFHPDPGVYEGLRISGNNRAVLYQGRFMGGLASSPFHPRKYVLTLKDGREYEYDRLTGLETIADRNGNIVEYTRDGVVHSSLGGTLINSNISFSRDPKGRITQITDPAGNAVYYSYDQSGDLRAFIDQASNTTSFAYLSSPAHYLTNIVDSLNRSVMRIQYNDLNQFAGIVDNLGNMISQEIDRDANLVAFNDANGNVIHSQFDDSGNEILRSVVGYYTNYFSYDSQNNLISIVNGLGHETQYDYDSRGNLTTYIDSLSNVTAVNYNEFNKPNRVRNPVGGVLDLVYDKRGQVIELVRNGIYRSTVNRDSQGRIIASTDFNGNTTTYEYESGCGCGRPSRIIHPDGTFRRIQYNDKGQTNQIIDELGFETVFEFDASGRLLWLEDALGNRTSYSYEGSQLTAITNALGQTTVFQYDAVGRTNAIINANGSAVRFEYDNNGNQTKVIDESGNATTFLYDGANRLIQRIDPNGGTNTFAHDPVGNVTVAVDRNGRKREFFYDAMNRMTNETWLHEGAVIRAINFEYNALGARTLATDQEVRNAFTYDTLNRLVSSSQILDGQNEFRMQYRHNALGQVEAVSDNFGVSVFTNYDDRNYMTNRTWTGHGVEDVGVELFYDAVGNRIRMNRYRELEERAYIGSTVNKFNPAGLITNLTHFGPAEDEIGKYEYQFDSVHRIKQWIIGGDLSVLSYDKLGQITNVISGLSQNESFTYDLSGNRKGDGYVIGLGNRVLASGNISYEYDKEGNLHSTTNLSTGDSRILTYDHRNRLTQVIDFDSLGIEAQRIDFRYDALNRRISKAVNGIIKRYIYDGNQPWADVDSNQNIEKRFLTGLRIDEVWAQFDAAEGITWNLADHIKSVRQILDMNGEIIQSFAYSAFGIPNSDKEITSNTRFLFAGREYDEEIDLYYLRSRYYTADLGRFISQDPIGFSSGEYNLYRYAGNQPQMFTDPMGTVSMFEYSRAVAFVALAAGVTTGVVNMICQASQNGGRIDFFEVAIAGGIGGATAAVFFVASTWASVGSITTFAEWYAYHEVFLNAGFISGIVSNAFYGSIYCYFGVPPWVPSPPWP